MPSLSTEDVRRWTTLSGRSLAFEVARRGWSDGLPLATATAGEVAAAVDFIATDADDVVAVIPPADAPLTAVALAAWTLLAGASPEHVRYVLACARALAIDELGALGALTTTGNAALVAIVNGPSTRRRGFHGGSNCLGPGSQANAAVGRALSLIVRNVGGAREGIADMATMGQPAKLGTCFAENEAESPWAPLTIDRGYTPEDDVVTLVAVSGILEVYDGTSSDPTTWLDVLGAVMGTRSSRHATPGPEPDALVLVSPEWARGFAAAGFSKIDVRDEILRRSGRDLDGRGGDVHLIVAGGVGIKQTFIPCWRGSRPVSLSL